MNLSHCSMEAISCIQKYNPEREKAWTRFFQDPSMWWDKRGKKWDLKYPEFKHATTGEALYIDSCPAWMQHKLTHLTETPSGRARYKESEAEETLWKLVTELKQCAKRRDLQRGKHIFSTANAAGVHNSRYISHTLISMYSKCNSMQDAQDVFEKMTQHDVVSWNVLIMGYVENGENSMALDVFTRMDCPPSHISFVAVLKACSNLKYWRTGIHLHGQATKYGFDKEVTVASTLVELYSKSDCLVRAEEVFYSILRHNVASWTALILGYMENEEYLLALDLFTIMDCPPDTLTYDATLKACASVGALEAGQRIHRRIQDLGLEQDEKLATSLVDFYAKSGNMATAEEVFNKVRYKDSVLWTALIGGYAALGDASQVFRVVKGMEEAGLRMNSVTLLLVLTACSHAGMVEEGKLYFESMLTDGITPTVEHYTCMVDMLGRVNRLQEALSVVNSMPFEGDSVVWMSLLGACRKWNNVQVAKVAFRALVEDKEYRGVARKMMRHIRNLNKSN